MHQATDGGHGVCVPVRARPSRHAWRLAPQRGRSPRLSQQAPGPPVRPPGCTHKTGADTSERTFHPSHPRPRGGSTSSERTWPIDCNRARRRHTAAWKSRRTYGRHTVAPPSLATARYAACGPCASPSTSSGPSTSAERQAGRRRVRCLRRRQRDVQRLAGIVPCAAWDGQRGSRHQQQCPQGGHVPADVCSLVSTAHDRPSNAR